MVPSLQPPGRCSPLPGLGSGTSSPKGSRGPAVTRSGTGAPSFGAPGAWAPPSLIGGAWAGQEVGNEPSSPRSPDAGAQFVSSDEEGALSNNAAAVRNSRIAGLQAENAALKQRVAAQEGQLRGALLKGEGMQLALRRIAEAASISAGDRPRSPSDMMGGTTAGTKSAWLPPRARQHPGSTPAALHQPA